MGSLKSSSFAHPDSPCCQCGCRRHEGLPKEDALYRRAVRVLLKSPHMIVRGIGLTSSGISHDLAIIPLQVFQRARDSVQQRRIDCDADSDDLNNPSRQTEDSSHYKHHAKAKLASSKIAVNNFSSCLSDVDTLNEGDEYCRPTCVRLSECATNICSEADPPSSKEITFEKIRGLGIASRLNKHATYLMISIYAVTGSSLFQWEQSAVTVPMAPVIPASLYCTTLLCTLGLPLSMVATSAINDLQSAVEKCSEVFSKNGTHQSEGGEKLPDMEQPALEHDKCRCMKCIPNVRRVITYCAIYLPSAFAAMAFVLTIVALVTLMFATETYKTAIISTACCIPGMATFVSALGWMMFSECGAEKHEN